MAKKKITDEVRDILQNFIEERELVLWNLEYVKEGKDWFLRIYIDKPNTNQGGISLDDCESVSRYLSDIMDEKDFIEQNYYLEVSSPGLDRQLIEDWHYSKYVGSKIDFKLYEQVEGSKKFKANLVVVSDKGYLVKKEDGAELLLERDKIAKARLVVEI